MNTCSSRTTVDNKPKAKRTETKPVDLELDASPSTRDPVRYRPNVDHAPEARMVCMWHDKLSFLDNRQPVGPPPQVVDVLGRVPVFGLPYGLRSDRKDGHVNSDRLQVRLH